MYVPTHFAQYDLAARAKVAVNGLCLTQLFICLYLHTLFDSIVYMSVFTYTLREIKPPRIERIERIEHLAHGHNSVVQ